MNQLKLFIRTRGYTNDYQFLISQPPDFYSNYKQLTDVESPSCILEKPEINKPLYLFLSGIPSIRKDRQGTPIRYDIVAEINLESWDKSTEHIDGLIQLITIWLNEIKEERNKSDRVIKLPTGEKSKLGNLLDRTLFEDYIEELVNKNEKGLGTEEDYGELNKKLKELLAQLSQQFSSSNSIDNKYSWWGGIDNPDSYNDWLKLVEKIIKTEIQGKAFLLNGATPQSLVRINLNEKETTGILLGKDVSNSQPQIIKTSSSSFLEKMEKRGQDDVKKVKNSIKKTISSLFLFLGIPLAILSYFFLNSNSLPNTPTGNINQKPAIVTQPPKNKNFNLNFVNNNLQITGNYDLKAKPEQICILSIVDNGQKKREFYLDGKERFDSNNCLSEISQGTIDDDGTWKFEHQFDYETKREIKIEKIYNTKQNNSSSESSYYILD